MPTIRISPRAIIRRDGRYLVVRCRDDRGDWFVFPGGGQHPGEDLHEALTREAEEEVGARPVIGALRCVRECIAARIAGSNLPSEFHQLEVFFDCTIREGSLSPGHTPDPGQVGLAWMTIGEMRQARFFPQAILDRLDDDHAVYVGAC